ncbi:MAG: hypothetical protein PHY62_10190 [Gallionella sp.]|nr:hypothetical protein [Gallionella sp.]
MKSIYSHKAILIAACFACCLSACSKSNSQPTWNEEVLLQDGRTLLVTRTESSGHPISHQSISFKSGGDLVTWEDNHKWRIDYTPQVLDFVGSDPVVVMPVFRYGPCQEYDYPQEGLVAFRYSQNQWTRMPIQELPDGMAVNLLQGGADELARWPEYQSTGVITNKLKEKIDADSIGPQKQNTKLGALIKYFSTLGSQDSCASIQPPSNPVTEAARVHIADAINNAPTIQATLENVISTPKKLTNNERYPKQGIRMEGGLVGFECKDLVEQLEPMYKFQKVGNTENSSLNGYQFILTNKDAIPRHVQLPFNGALMNRLVCNDKEIYAIVQQTGTNLHIYRFTNLGVLQQALKVSLPDTEDICKNYCDLWDVKVINNGLEIILVDGGKNESDILTKQQIYRVPLQEQQEAPAGNSAPTIQ